ncbi:MAG TPA: LuxR C-terminal-related transcriptional regulator [Candidatus Paceibacterota bacterium]|nr:LuxR C-terminal-related transcriptional regulator [Candidatus Paceibacterota bacterium]
MRGKSLSPREIQIVRLIGQAKANKEIAYELRLTEGTIKEYLYHIFRKLGVTSRTELALAGINFASPEDARSQMLLFAMASVGNPVFAKQIGISADTARKIVEEMQASGS